MDKKSLYREIQLDPSAHYIMILAAFRYIIFIHSS